MPLIWTPAGLVWEKASFHGIRYAVEYRKGDVRRGTNRKGEAWERTMQCAYGRLSGESDGGDGEALDVFVGDDENAFMCYAVEQLADGEFDEWKILLGFPSKSEALKTYLAHYPPGWTHGRVESVPVTGLREWMKRRKLAKILRREGDKWNLYSHEGKLLGSHDSEGDALAQERAIEVNKQKTDPITERARAEGVDAEQLREGVRVESEHADVTGGDMETTIRIALAHLREKPDYYTRLRAVEKGRVVWTPAGLEWEAKEWQQARSRTGSSKWVDSETDEVRYQEAKPGGPSGSKKEPESQSVVAAESLPAPKSVEELPDYIARVMQDPAVQEGERRYVADSQSDTKSLYTANGEWAPERAALHEEILAKAINPRAVSDQPKAILTLGPPGAGKTTVLGPRVKALVGEATIVNPDAMKAHLPEYEGGKRATLVHEESSYLAKRVRDYAIANSHNVVFDETGRNEERITQLVDQLAEKGYEVHVMLADVPEHVSVKRAVDRFKTGEGRYTPLDYIVSDVDGKPRKTFDSLKNHPGVTSGARLNNDVPMGTAPILEDEWKRKLLKFLRLSKSDMPNRKKDAPRSAREVAVEQEDSWLALLTEESL